MSSLKAGQGLSQYLKTRGEAETLVKASALDWTIYQPSVIFGEGDGLVSRFAALLRRMPLLPLARAQARMAPTFVGDVAEAIARCIGSDQLGQRRSFELYGPEVFTLGEIVVEDPRRRRPAHTDHRAARQPRPAAGTVRRTSARQTLLARQLPLAAHRLRSARSTATPHSASRRNRSLRGCRCCSTNHHGMPAERSAPAAPLIDRTSIRPHPATLAIASTRCHTAHCMYRVVRDEPPGRPDRSRGRAEHQQSSYPSIGLKRHRPCACSRKRCGNSRCQCRLSRS